MLDILANWFVFSFLKMAPGPMAESALFFVEDSLKVTILLALVVFIVAVVRTFITPARIKRLLGGPRRLPRAVGAPSASWADDCRREGVGNVLAALLGIPTPFCSCSAVPMFLGLVEAGVPLGVTFSFLIASPLINEVAAALLLAMFGWQIAALYIGSGFVIAVLAGIVIGRLKMENELEDIVRQKTGADKKQKQAHEKRMTWPSRFEFAKSESVRITWTVLPYLLVGIGIGALIHGYAPADFLLSVAGPDNPLAVPIAVLVGIPLYSNAAGMVPIVGVLMSKGMAAGTALAFMMSVIGLSFPEMVILRRVLRPKLLAAFALVLFLAFTLTGYLFNAILA